MFKLKINNFDILPFIFGLIIIAMIGLNELHIKGIIHLRYGFQYIKYFVPIVFAFAVLNYVKKMQSPDGVELSDLFSTEDIRTPSFRYKGSVNQGTNISFVKFYFAKNEVYMYYRNFFPIKVYYGPFTICKKDSFSSAGFILKEFQKINTNEAKLSIQSQNGLTSYTFNMRNISGKDFKLLGDNLKDF
ncbi:hypothetical protein M2347_002578 [Chryseobacterium sp. H1D6B]|uniref:hypothetical protein n=1 Tax=Chryseobacterium sp. H1D6B TaxID=2940588 RepID=UPI0015CB77DE|nr:hypothetical protein [Chryseobacterium sp. H1D6B]MDH6252851.1 hypothetical protein [Chryseobacterium sp. H1D6B]